MENFLDFALQERYKMIEELGDKLADFDTLIEWNKC
jgi:hypothetical protein